MSWQGAKSHVFYGFVRVAVGCCWKNNHTCGSRVRHRLIWIKIAICMAACKGFILWKLHSCSRHAGSSIFLMWLFQCKREQPRLREKKENSVSVHYVLGDTSLPRARRKVPSITWCVLLIQPNSLHEDKAQKYCWVFLYASYPAKSLS